MSDILANVSTAVSAAKDLHSAMKPVMDRSNLAFKDLPSSRIDAWKNDTISNLHTALGGEPMQHVTAAAMMAASGNKDTRSIQEAIAGAATGLMAERVLSRIADGITHQVQNGQSEGAKGSPSTSPDFQRVQAVAMERYANMANPAIGLSGCSNLGNSLRSMGVTGQVCAGAGFQEKHGLPTGKPSAGVVLTARW